MDDRTEQPGDHARYDALFGPATRLILLAVGLLLGLMFTFWLLGPLFMQLMALACMGI